MYFPVK